MTHKKSKTVIASAVSLALASMMLAGGAYGGVIDNSNKTPGGAPLGSCGTTQAATEACVGAMDLGTPDIGSNIQTTIYKADGTVLGTMNTTTGYYPPMGLADYFISLVKSGTTVTAKLSGKVWPVGEPMAIKAVVGDMKTKEGKPNNCIINTAFLTADKNNGVSGLLDTANPVPVICSSDFQSHKRFKTLMQPASLDPATPIDLVFNVVDESSPAADGMPSLPAGAPGYPLVNPNTNNLRYYQVFSKINNYTDKRLAGYKVIVGTGTGSGFVPASQSILSGATSLASILHLSIGIGEGWSDGSSSLPDGSDLVDEDGGAVFSHGLFGPKDLPTDKHFRWPENGFFDARLAGFNVTQECATAAVPVTNPTPCPTYANPLFANTLTAYDTVKSTTPLISNYVGPVVPATGAVGLPFGDWLPFGWHPKGIFYDDDNDANTDAVLKAWWNGTQWLKNYDSSFAPATEAELATWGSDKNCGTADAPRSCYAIDDIEDTVNLGINYTIKVGDKIPGGKVTVRIIPIAAADQTAPVWANTPPPALPTTPTTPTEPTTPTPTVPVVSSSSGGGGGCAIGNDGRFDPTLPAMLFAGLGFLGRRRYKAGK